MPPVDLFGRTEAEIEKAIADGILLLEISSVWRGNDRLGAEIGAQVRILDMNRRLLAELRGERVEKPEGWRPDLAGGALEKWRKDICSMGYYRKEKR